MAGALHLERVTNHKYDLLEPTIRRYGDVAIACVVQDQETTYAPGKSNNGRFRTTITAHYYDGTWQVVHFQISGPIPEAPPAS